MGGFDLFDDAFWAKTNNEIYDAFEELRKQPLSYQDDPDRGGYWAAVTHADVTYVSTTPEIFRSAPTVSIGDVPPELGEFLSSMLATDGERHDKLRRIVSQAFTPRQVNSLSEKIAKRAQELVDSVFEMGSFDVDKELATPLPTETISWILGLGPEHYDEIVSAGEVFASATTRDFGAFLQAAQSLMKMIQAVADKRRDHPEDDVISALVNGNVDGESLTQYELSSFFILLIAAGIQTTRHTIEHGMVAFAESPDQLSLLRKDPDIAPRAIEELVRFTTPVRYFRRTTAIETTLGGRQIGEGEKVVIWYTSANFDEEAFDNPRSFNVTRSPNRHVSFGGGGPHFCLGAFLARRELAALFTELASRCEGWEITEKERATSSFSHMYSSLKCSL